MGVFLGTKRMCSLILQYIITASMFSMVYLINNQIFYCPWSHRIEQPSIIFTWPYYKHTSAFFPRFSVALRFWKLRSEQFSNRYYHSSPSFYKCAFCWTGHNRKAICTTDTWVPEKHAENEEEPLRQVHQAGEEHWLFQVLWKGQ